MNLHLFRKAGSRSNPPTVWDYPVVTNPVDKATLRELARSPGFTSLPAGKPFSDAVRTVSQLLDAGLKKRSESGTPLEISAYQLIGPTFLMLREGRGMILDPMGLGKTLQGLATLVAGQQALRMTPQRFQQVFGHSDQTAYMPALVIAPDAAFSSWRDNTRDWTSFNVTVSRSAQELVELVSRASDADVVVTSRESFRRVIEAPETAGLLESRIKTLIFDEAHLFKSAGSQLAQAAFKAVKAIPHVIVLTGTPIMSALGEMYSLMQFVEPRAKLAEMNLVISGETPSKRQQAQYMKEKEWIQNTFDIPEKEIGPTSVGAATIKEWGSERSKKVSDRIAESGVRRTREAVVLAGTMGQRSLKRKHRVFKVVYDLPQDYIDHLTRVVSQSALRTGQLRTGRSSEESQEQATAYLSGRQTKFDEWKSSISRVADWIQDGKISREEAIDRLVNELRASILQGYLPLPRSIDTGDGDGADGGTQDPSDFRNLMGRVVLPEAVRMYEDEADKSNRPVVFFAYNKRVASELADLLKSNGALVYLADGSMIYTVAPGQEEKRLTFRDGTETKKDFNALKAMYADPRKLSRLSPAQQRAAIILTTAGSAGVNLGAARKLIFVQRLRNAGEEAQAEDRINRPEADADPTIVYLIPADPFSFVLINRMEQKRNNLMQSFGESITSDYSYPLVAPSFEELMKKMDPNLRDSFSNAGDFLELLEAEMNPVGVVTRLLDRKLRMKELGKSKETQMMERQLPVSVMAEEETNLKQQIANRTFVRPRLTPFYQVGPELSGKVQTKDEPFRSIPRRLWSKKYGILRDEGQYIPDGESKPYVDAAGVTYRKIRKGEVTLLRLESSFMSDLAAVPLDIVAVKGQTIEADEDALSEVAEEIEVYLDDMAKRSSEAALRHNPKKSDRKPQPRNVQVQNMLERKQKAGSHHTRSLDVKRGRSRKPKFKKDYER